MILDFVDAQKSRATADARMSLQSEIKAAVEGVSSWDGADVEWSL